MKCVACYLKRCRFRLNLGSTLDLKKGFKFTSSLDRLDPGKYLTSHCVKHMLYLRFLVDFVFQIEYSMGFHMMTPC